MKKEIALITFVIAHMISIAQVPQQTKSVSTDAAFYSAYSALKNMLEGKDSLNYEKAVFLTENAYYNNYIEYDAFSRVLDFHTVIIKAIAENARKENQEKYKSLKLYEQKTLNLNATNWAIYKYITDTTSIVGNEVIFSKMPFNYTTQDPYGSNNWQNTQILNLLASKEQQGNCYALAILFKIFSDRLQSDARLTVAPHHIYIQNRNTKGDFKNVELTTKTFPGDGSIQTLTYTTHELIMNGMSQRMLSDKNAIALNLIYLAKGFEHKFKDNTNDFLLKCADLAFKYDSLSLNALLLKAEVTENRLLATMKKNKITTVSQARVNLQVQKLVTSYEKQLNNLYKIGYREIPKDIEQILLSANQGNKDGYITTDKTPNPFASIGQKQRYATLSWGLFDEIHADVDFIDYFHVSLDTKKGKIVEFLPFDTTNNYKVDPVVFAMNVDPLASKYPNMSPYSAFANNPILFADTDGREFITYVNVKNKETGKSELHKVTFDGVNTTIENQKTNINSNYEGGSKFVDDMISSYNYIVNNGADVDNAMQTLASSKTIQVEVKEAKGYGKAEYKDGVITFNFKEGTQLFDDNKKLGNQSPALGFWSESYHAFIDLVDSKAKASFSDDNEYLLKEEKYVHLTKEHQVVDIFKKNGEGNKETKRATYEPGDAYYNKGIENPTKTENYE